MHVFLCIYVSFFSSFFFSSRRRHTRSLCDWSSDVCSSDLCTIILPLGLFLYQLFDERLRNFFRWLLAAQTAFAIFGILAAALRVSLTKLSFANNFVVLGTLLATALFLVANKWRPGPRQRLSREFLVFVGGFLVWMLFVVHANLLGLKILKGQNVEFLGFLVFVATLGYVSGYRPFANE